MYSVTLHTAAILLSLWGGLYIIDFYLRNEDVEYVLIVPINTFRCLECNSVLNI